MGSRTIKTYKFLAIAYNTAPETVDNKTVRLMRIKAFRSDTAQKTAFARIAKLGKKTGVKWKLYSEPAPMSARDKHLNRMLKLARRVNDLAFEIARPHKDLPMKIIELTKSKKYKAADIPERALMTLSLLHRNLGESEMLHEAIELSLLMNPLIVKRPELLEGRDKAMRWFTTPQAELGGEIPWILMQTNEGTKKIKRLIGHINDGAEKIDPDKGRAKASEAKTCSEILSVKVSGQGNIKLPRKVLEILGLKEGDAVELIIDDGTLTVIPATSRPRAYKRLLTLSARVLGSEKNAVLWLHAPQFGLGGRRPIDHMRSTKGAQEVESIL